MTELRNFLISVKDVEWIDWRKLTNWSYLTDSAVPTDSPLTAFLAYAFLLLIIVGLVANLVLLGHQKTLPIYGRLRYHIFNMSIWLGITGLVLVFARYQALYLLSSRLLLLALILSLLIWGGWIIYYSLFRLPIERGRFEEYRRFSRYLPKPKVKSIKL